MQIEFRVSEEFHNETTEKVIVEYSASDLKSAQITLEVPKFEKIPPVRIYLTDREFEEIEAFIARARAMRNTMQN